APPLEAAGAPDDPPRLRATARAATAAAPPAPATISQRLARLARAATGAPGGTAGSTADPADGAAMLSAGLAPHTAPAGSSRIRIEAGASRTDAVGKPEALAAAVSVSARLS